MTKTPLSRPQNDGSQVPHAPYTPPDILKKGPAESVTRVTDKDGRPEIEDDATLTWGDVINP